LIFSLQKGPNNLARDKEIKVDKTPGSRKEERPAITWQRMVKNDLNKQENT
jgi:hypothetical protein